MDEETLLSKELDFVSQEAREMMLNAIHCALHNQGYSLTRRRAGTG